ncbi:TPA: zinc metalloprotease ywhC [Candidatus Saccharibacteria bacterium]|nr:zinc metalloprotease ywhC [Candidatus Saccharibacteria bacterium]HRK41255.1 site-2 protease family protein [Candidatus Saccharibacteria bacterium]
MTFDVAYIALVIATVLASMTLHEAMHAYTGHWLGDDTAKIHGRLTLNPIAHIDPFLTLLLPVMLAVLGLPIFGGAKPVPFNPMRVRYGELGAALVGLAGPLTNLVIAFFAFGIAAIFGINAGDFLAYSFADLAFTTVVFVNLGFFIFNMLPIPPLDGSRLLYAVAPDGFRSVMEVIERNGIILVFALVLLFSQQIGQFIIGARDVILAVFSVIFGVS